MALAGDAVGSGSAQSLARFDELKAVGRVGLRCLLEHCSDEWTHPPAIAILEQLLLNSQSQVRLSALVAVKSTLESTVQIPVRFALSLKSCVFKAIQSDTSLLCLEEQFRIFESHKSAPMHEGCCSADYFWDVLHAAYNEHTLPEMHAILIRLMGRQLGQVDFGRKSAAWCQWSAAIATSCDPGQIPELRAAAVQSLALSGALEVELNEPELLLGIWQSVMVLLQDDDAQVRGQACVLVLGLHQEHVGQVSGIQQDQAIKCAHGKILTRFGHLSQACAWIEATLVQRSVTPLSCLLSRAPEETRRIFEKERENFFLEDLVISHQTATALHELGCQRPELRELLQRNAQDAIETAGSLMNKLSSDMQLGESDRPLENLSVQEVSYHSSRTVFLALSTLLMYAAVANADVKCLEAAIVEQQQQHPLLTKLWAEFQQPERTGPLTLSFSSNDI
eukprot:TRINITY_DN20620_c0_g1_i1.p1 TRINITY_DN20620_c0_g1~~TRINITY_DN20620_c0_g1_i1.p1  ORF type:complete len:450 (+),score=65.58 TRINITY_DN20620_c0_g1_i1:207-1556(+)